MPLLVSEEWDSGLSAEISLITGIDRPCSMAHACFARNHSHQILAVLIRDADGAFDQIDDLTGWKAIGAAGTCHDTLLLNRSESTDEGPQ